MELYSLSWFFLGMLSIVKYRCNRNVKFIPRIYVVHCWLWVYVTCSLRLGYCQIFFINLIYKLAYFLLIFGRNRSIGNRNKKCQRPFIWWILSYLPFSPKNYFLCDTSLYTQWSVVREDCLRNEFQFINFSTSLFI